MDRITKNWRTTSLAIIILVLMGFLIYTDKIHLDEIKGILTLVFGGGAAVGLAGSKDPKKQ